jgi:hypothetical protein
MRTIGRGTPLPICSSPLRGSPLASASGRPPAWAVRQRLGGAKANHAWTMPRSAAVMTKLMKFLMAKIAVTCRIRDERSSNLWHC